MTSTKHLLIGLLDSVLSVRYMYLSFKKGCYSSSWWIIINNKVVSVFSRCGHFDNILTVHCQSPSGRSGEGVDLLLLIYKARCSIHLIGWFLQLRLVNFDPRFVNIDFSAFCVGSLDSRTSLLPSLPSAIGKTVRHVNEVNRRYFQIWGPFLESPGNFSGPESWIMIAGFAFNIKVSIILKMMKWNCQLTKQNWLVCELSYRAFRERGPGPARWWYGKK